MKNLKDDIKDIGKVVIVFLVVFGLVMLLGLFIKLIFN